MGVTRGIHRHHTMSRHHGGALYTLVVTRALVLTMAMIHGMGQAPLNEIGSVPMVVLQTGILLGPTRLGARHVNTNVGQVLGTVPSFVEVVLGRRAHGRQAVLVRG